MIALILPCCEYTKNPCIRYFKRVNLKLCEFDINKIHIIQMKIKSMINRTRRQDECKVCKGNAEQSIRTEDQ